MPNMTQVLLKHLPGEPHAKYYWLLKHQVDRSVDNTPNRIAYLNVERGQRLQLKVGRFVRKYFGEGLSDQEIQTIGDRINAELWTGTNGVQLLTGEAIREAYLDCRASSCMTYRCTQSYLVIYADNPDKIALAYVRDDDGHVARALVFTDDTGKRHMSTIYHSSTHLYQVLADYGDSQVWANPYDMRITVKIRNGVESNWPYSDSWSVDIESSTVAVLSTSGGTSLDETNGSCGDSSNMCCSVCDCEVDEDDSHSLDGGTYCEECFNEAYRYCDHCNG